MPSLGKDLTKIRFHLGITVQDIHYATKIPFETIQAIENDSIFSRSDDGKTYIRSFVRSYGRALKINDETMIKALDQQEAGNYSNLLLLEFEQLARRERAESETQTENLQKEHSEKVAETEKKAPDPGSTSGQSEQKPGTSNRKPAPKKEKPAAGEPAVKNVNWADMGRKFSNEKKQTPVWIVGLIILLIIAAIAGYVLYNNGYFAALTQTDSPQEVQSGSREAQGSLSLNLDEQPPESADRTSSPIQNIELDDVLYITVYAAYDNLAPVRVWSDLKPRLDPYWLEQGVALNFEFQDTIRIRGGYSDFLLFKNGHLIENFFENYYDDEENVIELTRSQFTAEPKWAETTSFELPEGVDEPDSLAIRPSF